MKRFTGQVASGIGYGVTATELPWFRASLKDHFGLTIAPGTLNLNPVLGSAQLHELLLTAGTVLVPPSLASCCSLLLPVRIMHGQPETLTFEPAIIVRPLVRSYPEQQVELVAAQDLRTLLGVNDGDSLRFEVPIPPKQAPWIQATMEEADDAQTRVRLGEVAG